MAFIDRTIYRHVKGNYTTKESSAGFVRQIFPADAIVCRILTEAEVAQSTMAVPDVVPLLEFVYPNAVVKTKTACSAVDMEQPQHYKPMKFMRCEGTDQSVHSHDYYGPANHSLLLTPRL